MTLVELLVALVISGMVASVAYASTSSMLEHRRQALAVAGEITEAATVRSLIASWLAGAQMSSTQGGAAFQSVRVGEGSRHLDELTFITAAPTPLDEDLVMIRLAIDGNRQAAQGGLVAHLSDLRGQRTIRLVLSPRVQAMSVSSLIDVSGERVWLREWVSDAVLPLAVQLTFPQQGAEPIPLLMRHPLLVLVGVAR